MAITPAYEVSALLISTSEKSLVTGTTTPGDVTDEPGIYSLTIDPSNMAKGDWFEARLYEKVEGVGGTQRLIDRIVIGNAQARDVRTAPMMLLHDWDWRLIRTAGSDHNFDASLRKLGVCEEAYSQDGLTVSTTELSLTNGTSSLATIADAPGAYQLWIDAAAMQKGDTFEVALYEAAVQTDSTQRKLWTARVHDVQVGPWYSPIFELQGGWEWSIVRVEGSDRSLDASIRRVV